MNAITTDALILAWLGCLTGLLGALLLMLLTGGKIKVELVLPTVRLAPVQARVVMRSGEIQTKIIENLTIKEVERYRRVYGHTGWRVTDVKWSGDGKNIIALSRWHEE